MRHRRERLRWVTGLLSALALLGPAVTASPAVAADTQKSTRVAQGPVTWSADLSRVDADDVNVSFAHGALGLRRTDTRVTATTAGERGYGTQVLAPRTLDRPVNRVRAELSARTPSGARVTVEVRGRSAEGTWTEWREVEGTTAVALPRTVAAVQARLTLWDEDGRARVDGLRLTADRGPGPRAAGAAAAAVSARVFATREGLVGRTTANGHVIQPNDHFVALPSRRGLSPNGSGQYSVRVCGPARCETAPVWDVGPWNTRDDYWNPSSVRESFKDLPQGRPEAQAAYESGYNGGRDGSGRLVANPAGIDLADGTFADIGLADNGWVTVTYLWTGGSAGTSFPTWGTDVRVREQPTTRSREVSRLPGPTRVTVSCQVHGERITVEGITNDGWAYLPDHGGYVSNIFIDVPEAWLPGVPTC
ncbi:hypothetical protein OG349_32845 [Streptomyces sp. NBC_01317]|uniref:hypothetical protein n=1 Tax=Streptomyces sp. NBC_01317 TaxID=2903822 RepID=UPI002E118155|nr:hypothetical protein OG349_32845 [Streptomyces sp. NBC_01317]